MKESFIIHTSFYEPIKSLSDKQLGRIFRALFDYQLGNEVQVEDDIRMAFMFFKNQMDIETRRYQAKVEVNKQNAAKGGAPRGNSNARKKTTENNRNNRTVEKTTETTLYDNDYDNGLDITTTITDVIDSSTCRDIDNTLTLVSTKRVRAKEPSKSESMIVDVARGKVSGGAWKTDFDAYKSGLRQCYTALRKDVGWLDERKRLNPGVNVELTMEKACLEFWATEAGWANKKAKRANTIDWRATLTAAISQKHNKVYDNGPTSSVKEGKRGFDAEYRADILRRIDAPRRM